MARGTKKAKREFDLVIDGLTHDGRGVGRLDGKAVFVSGALPGERVRVQQTGRNRHYDEGRVIELYETSPDRITPQCPHYGTCSGCVLQHMAPARQIEVKQNILMENLQRIGHVSPERVFPVLAADSWHYRRKGRFSVRYVEKKAAVLVGFRETDPRFVAQLGQCETVLPSVSALIAPLSLLIAAMDAKREIPQIEFIQGDGPVALVFRNLAALNDGDTERLVEFERQHNVQIFLQPGGVQTVTPLREGYDPLYFDLPGRGIRFFFRPLDFIQVNAALNEAMIAMALEQLQPNPGDAILDLFCGLGNFTLPLAQAAGQVTGVEGDPALVARARENAVHNGIVNAEFFASDLTQDDPTQLWKNRRYNKMLIDPPRAGAIEVLRQLDFKGIERIVYISCHPASLARDAGFLVQERGYRLVAAGAMDMFPQTAHVESVAVFEKS